MVHLVTGGAGFIGSHLVNSLLTQGEEVIAVDNLVRGKTAYLEREFLNPRFKFVEVDCSKLQEFQRGVESVLNGRRGETIWHLAANSDIPAGIADPEIDLRDTFMTTFNALRVMQKCEFQCFNFASSSAVYGDFGESEISEDSAPCLPISNYGAMKLASEGQISAALEVFGRRACIFRFPNVVGAPATHGVIFDFVQKLRVNSKLLEVLGDGSQQKSYLHVTDLIQAMQFIHKSKLDKVSVFNIGPSDEGVTVRSIAQWVCECVSPSATIAFGKGARGWIGDVPKFRYSTHRLKTLGWQPKLDSEAAVRAAIHDITARM